VAENQEERDAKQQAEGIRIGADVSIKQQQIQAQQRNRPTKGE
jgi:hypothetical protein